MTELTQPEKLGRSIIEQYLDGREVMDSYTMSVDILAKLNNGGLKIARVAASGPEADDSLTDPSGMGFPE